MSSGLLGIADERSSAAREKAAQAKPRLQAIDSWNPGNFAREQIRGLVRQVFFGTEPQPARQVVFSAVEPEESVSSICVRVGEALAMETSADVAIVGTQLEDLEQVENWVEDARNDSRNGSTPLRKTALRLRKNLWFIPGEIVQASPNSALLHSFFSDVRREFEYSIVEAQRAGESSAATETARVADGLILVISAQRTRRASALKVKQMLEEFQVRILGAVFNDREFPIPEKIYRRL